MKMTQAKSKKLKDFAITLSWAFPLFFSILLPWLFDYAWQLWPLLVPTLLLTLLFIKPSWLHWPHKGWMAIAGVIGWINTRVILGVCFYLLITPIGLVLKLFGKLQYRNKPQVKGNNNRSSNYVTIEAKSDKKNLEYPF